MHSRIFELSIEPVDEDSRYTSDYVPDWFVDSISDGIQDIDIPEEREEDIKWLASYFDGACLVNGDMLTFAGDAKEKAFDTLFKEMKAHAEKIAKADFDAFCGKDGLIDLKMDVYQLCDAFSNKYGFYIYEYEAGYLRTIAEWLRNADLSKPYYVGGIVDYHA